MKKFISLILSGIMAVSCFTGCTSKTPSNSEPVPSQEPDINHSEETLGVLRDILNEQGFVAGCAYIGGILGEHSNYDEFLEEVETVLGFSMTATMYDFMLTPDASHIIEMGGYELYCIVPADENASVSVNRYICDESNGFVGEAGELYYKSETGEPIYVLCNVSDAVPNAQVSIIDSKGNTCVFEPRLSLYNGAVTLPFNEPVEDITIYGYETDLAAIQGGWCTPFDDAVFGEVHVDFQISDYNDVKLTYYAVDSDGLYDVITEYSGRMSDFSVIYGGDTYYTAWLDFVSYDSYGNVVNEMSGEYDFQPAGDELAVYCSSGDEIVPGISIDTVFFTEVNG